MKQPSALVRALMWIVYAILIVINGFALVSILSSNSVAIEQNRDNAVFDPSLMVAGLFLLTVGLLLFSFLKKRHGIALAITLAAGVLLAFNAVALGNHFMAVMSGVPGDNNAYGMSAEKLILRHWSIELIPFLMLLDWLRMHLPQWLNRLANIPEAVVIPAGASAPDSTLSSAAIAAADEDRLLCPLCNATFRNAVTDEVFTCPYCHGKLRSPGASWEGKKQKKSIAVRARKAEKKNKE